MNLTNISRSSILSSIDNNVFDVIIIGGGATGLGCAVDAVTRGYKTLLVEATDYAKSTSSRSTKLLHGGIRYLSQGYISLVKTALKERMLALNNAPHLSSECTFIIPCYNLMQIPYYLTGLKAYDWFAGSLKLSASKRLSKEEVMTQLPSINSRNLKGGIRYSDGVFDDSRMCITLLRTFLSLGGVASNYLEVVNLIKENNKIIGVELLDNINNNKLIAKSNCVINATGIFADNIRKLDDANSNKVIKWAQGIHLVLNKEEFVGDNALVIPKTSDGRILFFVPWHNKVLCGTTDTAIDQCSLEPRAYQSEIEFVLFNVNKVLSKKINYENINSIYTGIRPLVMDGHAKTSKIARDDKIFLSESGLISITGGKWTTYRKMAEKTIDFAINNNFLKMSPNKTKTLHLYGYLSKEDALKIPEPFRVYGSDYNYLSSLPNFSNSLSNKVTINEAQVEYSIKFEQAQTLDDVLSRRIRVLFFDSEEAINIAPKVVKIMSKILEKNISWEQEQISKFNAIANNYRFNSY